MLIRSGKMQFLFWAAFFSVMLYLWIIAVGLQTFVLPDEKPMEIPYNVVLLMFLLYGLFPDRQQILPQFLRSHDDHKSGKCHRSQEPFWLVFFCIEAYCPMKYSSSSAFLAIISSPL